MNLWSATGGGVLESARADSSPTQREQGCIHSGQYRGGAGGVR